MPLILCPVCGRITYAYPIYEDVNEPVAVRCKNCNNIYSIEQVDIIDFPHETINLRATFADIIADILNITVDEVYDYDDIVKQFYNVLVHMTRQHGLRINRYKPAYWDYRGTREADEYNNELLERLQEYFADDVNNGYIIIEIIEPDEGDSLYISIHPDDAELMKKVLKPYI